MERVLDHVLLVVRRDEDGDGGVVCEAFRHPFLHFPPVPQVEEKREYARKERGEVHDEEENVRPVHAIM